MSSNLEFLITKDAKDRENFNDRDKDKEEYYNDLPGKLPPEMSDPVEDIPPHPISKPSKKPLTIQVSLWSLYFIE